MDVLAHLAAGFAGTLTPTNPAMAFVGWQLASFRGLPNVLVVLAVLIILYAFFTENTVQGRRIYAVGGNYKAAMLSGIRAERLVFFLFAHLIHGRRILAAHLIDG